MAMRPVNLKTKTPRSWHNLGFVDSFMATQRPTAEDLQSLVERFGRAGWIAETNIVGPRNFSLVFTPLGQRRLFEIFAVSESEKDGQFIARRQVIPTQSPETIDKQYEQTVLDIQPPELTDCEWEMLKALARGFASAASS